MSSLDIACKMKQINKNIFDRERYIIQNDKKFPILFEVIIEEDEIIIYIPVPDKYNKTSLTNMYDIFGMASISYANNYYTRKTKTDS